MQELPIKLYGLFDVHGEDDHLLVAQEALLGEPFVYEELTVDSVVWARSNGDAWEQQAGEADTVDRLRRSIDEAAGWTNVGSQPTSGQASQRLKAAGSPVDVSDFGFIYPDGFDSSLSLEIETTHDGTPLGMHIAGDSFQAELSCGGRTLSRPVAPPTSKPVEMSQGVSVAVPEGWGINRSESTKLVVFGPDPQWIAVQGATAEGMTLDEWTADGAAYFSKEWDAKHEAVSSIMVADEPASLAIWHLPIDGVATHFLNVSAIRDGWGYDIEFFSQTGREPADRALFEQVLTTVVFGKK